MVRADLVAGGSLSANRRRDLPWGEHPRRAGDPDWDSPAFEQRYADVFRSNYIAELFCQLAGTGLCGPLSD